MNKPSGKVTAFPGVVDSGAKLDEQPQVENVKYLEKLLVEAKDGTVRGLAASVVRRGGVCSTAFMHDGLSGNDLGATIAQMSYDYCAARADEIEDDG